MNQCEGNSSSHDQIQKEIHKVDEANKKQEQRTRILETKAVQNVNLYFIFQAVILASASASTAGASSTSCRPWWWIPFTLSLLAAIINFLSFSATMSKVLKSRQELDQNLSDLKLMKSNQITRDKLNQAPPGAMLSHEGRELLRPKAGRMMRWKRCLVVYLSVGLFVGFSAIVIYGCYNILCHPGDRK